MSRFFIGRPIVAIVIAIVTVIGGLVAMDGLPVAQFPELVPPPSIVTTTYTGADAQTIEHSVATPLEQQMNGLDKRRYMQSTNPNDPTYTLTLTCSPSLGWLSRTSRAPCSSRAPSTRGVKLELSLRRRERK